jgi:transaldolase
LAGCDNLTIAPKLLEELSLDTSELPRRLSPETANRVAPLTLNEATFRWQMNADAMATEKLAEGIRGFDKDYNLLVQIVQDKLK